VTKIPIQIPITPSMMKSHLHGSLPIAAQVILFPIAYAIRPLKAPEKVEAE